MPFYEYVCLDCGNAFEKPDSKVADAGRCRACGSADIKKQITTSETPTSESCTPKG